jgi:hypothetical protein
LSNLLSLRRGKHCEDFGYTILRAIELPVFARAVTFHTASTPKQTPAAAPAPVPRRVAFSRAVADAVADVLRSSSGKTSKIKAVAGLRFGRGGHQVKKWRSVVVMPAISPAEVRPASLRPRSVTSGECASPPLSIGAPKRATCRTRSRSGGTMEFTRGDQGPVPPSRVARLKTRRGTVRDASAPATKRPHFGIGQRRSSTHQQPWSQPTEWASLIPPASRPCGGRRRTWLRTRCGSSATASATATPRVRRP